MKTIKDYFAQWPDAKNDEVIALVEQLNAYFISKDHEKIKKDLESVSSPNI